MYTIGRFARLFGLSRSTLLYYDSIGLLSPSGYSQSGYRQYSEKDRERLSRIMALRDMGLPLLRILDFLDSPQEEPVALILKRIFEINSQICTLRTQQSLLLGLLEGDDTLKGAKGSLHMFSGLGEKAGIGTENFRSLHLQFEEASPDAHRRLLRYLGFTDAETEKFLSHMKDSV